MENIFFVNIKLTVITVTYNAQSFLERTMDSVREQSLAGIEHLIQDGCSKDETLKMALQYEGNNTGNVEYSIHSEKDRGLYDAMNKAMAKARGEYICFLNAGDTFFDNHSLTKAFENADGEDFIYGKTIVVKEDGTTQAWHKPIPKPESLRPESFLNGMVICHQAMILRRSCAVTYDSIWKLSADIDWSIRVMRNVKSVHYYPDYLIKFLWGGLSEQRRKESLKERFQIGVSQFGYLPTIWAHVKIVIAWGLKKILPLRTKN